MGTNAKEEIVNSISQIDFFQKLSKINKDFDTDKCECCNTETTVLIIRFEKHHAVNVYGNLSIRICRKCITSLPWPDFSFKSEFAKMTEKRVNSISWPDTNDILLKEKSKYESKNTPLTTIKGNIIVIKSNKTKDLENFKKKNINEEIAWDDLNELINREKQSKAKIEDKCCDNPYIPTGNVCENCGFVVSNKDVSQSAEWNNYGDDDAVNPARCGNPINNLLPKSSMATEIAGNSRISQRNKWMRMDYEEKALLTVFLEIERRCEKYFSKRVIESSKYMFKHIRDLSSGKINCKVGLCKCSTLLPCNSKYISSISSGYINDDEVLELFTPTVVNHKSGIKRGKNLRSVVANCVDRSAKNVGEGAVSEQMISSLFDIDTKHMLVGKKIISEVLDSNSIKNHIKPKIAVRVTSQDLAKRLCIKLKMSNKHSMDVMKIIKFLKDNKFLTSKATASITAGCIYYTSVYHQLDNLENLSVERISSECGVSKNTIVKIYEEIDEIIAKSVKKVKEFKERKELN